MKILFVYGNPVSLALSEWLSAQGNELILFSDWLTEATLDALQPELVISYNYPYMISGDVIRRMGGNIINLHISLLPWNRGADPNFWSFWEDTPKGVTIHYIDERLDRGRVIAQREIALDPAQETFATSYDKLHKTMLELFKEIWGDYPNWQARSFLAQGLGSYHSQADKLQIANAPIDWNMNIQAFLDAHKHSLRGGAPYKYTGFFTERLVCRGIQLQDAADIVRWRSDHKIYQYFRNPQPVSMEEHLRWYAHYRQDSTRLDFICINRASGEKLGVVGIENISGDHADVAYIIGEERYQKKGYGTEAVAAMTRFAFERLAVNTLQAIVAHDNLPSRKLVEKLGYKNEFLIYTMDRATQL